MAYRVGVDIGGTFTDFAVLDDDNRLYTLKVFSTPGAPGQEIVNGIRGLQETYGILPSEISYLTHGTTVGVNSIIQRNGAQICMLATEGFEDVLELARLRVPDVTSMFSKRPAPLVARENVYPVGGRVQQDGKIHMPLDEAAVAEATKRAVATGMGGMVIGFVNSYRNPEQELRAKEIVAQVAPNLPVTCSAEIWPVIREYERFLTAVLNAYVRPKMSHYIDVLRANLKAEGVSAELQIAKSNGGTMRAELAKSNCIGALFSGTASGVVGASYVAGECGFNNVLSIDIGGTSADISLITDAEPRYGTGELVGDFPLHTPSVSVASIGGGGGSIAWLDEYGVLKSGPDSAGSEPGPAAYGKGGLRPTTTDAFVTCGFLGAAQLAYGKVSIDKGLAETAMRTISDKVGLAPREVAQNIIRVAVSGMYAETMKYFARHGAETDTLALMAFGGAGPMMACFVAREARIKTVIVPPTPGVLSALGGLVADTKHNLVRTIYTTLDDSLAERLRVESEAMATEARRWFEEEQNGGGNAIIMHSAELRYKGQSFEIDLPLSAEAISAGDLGAIRKAFDARHNSLFGYADPGAPVEIINLHTVISMRNERPKMALQPVEDYQAVPDQTVTVFFDDRAMSAGFFARSKLRPGARFQGPAIIGQSDTTTCVLPEYGVRVDGYGNLILELNA